jgi:hypothetical protein
MVTRESLFMEVVSVVVQDLLNPLCPVVKEEFQFIPLNFTQKFLNASEGIHWPAELLSFQCRLHVAEKSRSQKVPSQNCKANWALEQ